MERMITYPSLFEQELFYDEKKTVHEWSILLHDIHIEKRERNFTASLSLCILMNATLWKN